MKPDEFKQLFTKNGCDTWLTGEGLLYYKDQFASDGIHFIESEYWHSKAVNIYRIGFEKAQKGLFDDPLTLQPEYLRIPQAMENP